VTCNHSVLQVASVQEVALKVLMGYIASKTASGVLGIPVSPLTVTAEQWNLGFESPFPFSFRSTNSAMFLSLSC